MVAKSCINLIEGCDENTKRVSNGFSMFQQSVWWCRISQPSTVWRNHLLNQEIGSLTWFDMIEPSWMEFLQAVKITNARRTIGPIGMVYIYIYDYMIFNVYIYIHSNYIYTHSSKIICRYRVIYIIYYIYICGGPNWMWISEKCKTIMTSHDYPTWPICLWPAVLASKLAKPLPLPHIHTYSKHSRLVEGLSPTHPTTLYQIGHNSGNDVCGR